MTASARAWRPCCWEPAAERTSVPVETCDEALLRDLVEEVQNLLAVTYDFSARDHLGRIPVVRYMDSREYG